MRLRKRPTISVMSFITDFSIQWVN
jgi:hypothetical protein